MFMSFMPGLPRYRFLRIVIVGCFLMMAWHVYRLIMPTEVWIRQWLHAAESAVESPAGEASPPADKEKAEHKDFDVLNMTLEEFQLLTTWVNQSKKRKSSEEDMQAREQKYAIVKKEISEKVVELEALEKKLALLMKKKSAEEESHMKEIVKMFESMKPQVAAPIFAQLNPHVLLDILQHMKGQKTALILAQLPPGRAAKITEVMTYLAKGVEPLE